MSEYIYIASDSKLPVGSVGDNGLTVFKTTFYLTANSMESFFFEENYDPDEKKIFSFSKHFSAEKYQVASIVLTLPEQNTKNLKPRNKKALQELYHYIEKHFEHTNATYVEILFCLNSQEDEPLKQNQTINLDELSIYDLFYDDQKFLTINKQS